MVSVVVRVFVLVLGSTTRSLGKKVIEQIVKNVIKKEVLNKCKKSVVKKVREACKSLLKWLIFGVCRICRV